MTTTADTVMELAYQFADDVLDGADRRDADIALRAAVESLVAERDALFLLVKGIMDNRSHCFIPNTHDGLYQWDEIAERALRGQP